MGALFVRIHKVNTWLMFPKKHNVVDNFFD